MLFRTRRIQWDSLCPEFAFTAIKRPGEDCLRVTVDRHRNSCGRSWTSPAPLAQLDGRPQPRDCGSGPLSRGGAAFAHSATTVRVVAGSTDYRLALFVANSDGVGPTEADQMASGINALEAGDNQGDNSQAGDQGQSGN